MNHPGNANTSIRSKLRDLLAERIYPRYSEYKSALFSRNAAVQSAYWEGLAVRRQSVSWTGEQKLEWILDRLRLVVRRAYLDTDYYRELFDRLGFDPFVDFEFREFANLPVLEKRDIREEGPRLVSKSAQPGSLRHDSSGGSTGAPVHIWLGPEERGWRQSASDWVFHQLGLPRGSRTAYFWGHHLDPRGRGSIKERAYFYVTNAEWFDCLRLEPRVLDDFHQRLGKFHPACMIAYATALGALADHVLERGYQPDYPTRFILTGAEKLIGQHRRWAESAFGCPVYERYGSRDVGLMGFQSKSLASSTRFEIDWANVLIEPETDQPESPILVTKLHGDGMPMLRYRVGDVGSFQSNASPGEPALFLDEVVGREVEKIWLPDGSWVQGTFVPHLLKDYPVREYLVVQAADYSVELRIVPRAGFADLHRRRIRRLLSKNLRDLSVSVLLVDHIPRTQANKLKPVVSQVAEARRSCSA